jgi:DNA primase
MINIKKAAGYAKPAAQYKKLNVDFIKNSLSPLDFYRYELPTAPLKKAGWNDGGLCPFHSDNKPGSFRVNLTTGAYKCFACANYGGDVIAFSMALYGLNFVEALTKLADEWGLL